jgi:cytoskeletal protein RodZ
MKQPDKLFHDKLADFQRPAPTMAWEKISAAQKRKTNKVVWIKIAATVIPLCITVYLLWPEAQPVSNVPQNLATTTEESSTTNTAAASGVDARVGHKSSPASEPQSRGPIDSKATKAPIANKITSNEKNDEIQPVAIESPASVGPVLPHDQNVNIELASKMENTSTNDAHVEPTPGEAKETMTLVFTAKEVDNYLDKKNIAKATSDTKKPSTLMKLLKKANNLTSNQDPLGELRQKKSEILALNFKNDKQRGQNK